MNEIEKKDGSAGRRMPVRTAYLIWAGLALVGLVLYLVLRGAFGGGSRELLRHFSDACCLTGGLMSCFGGLGAVSRSGGYDVMGYGLKTFGELFKAKSWGEKPESYAEYKERKAAGRTRKHHPMLVVGTAVLAVGILTAVLYSVTAA